MKSLVVLAFAVAVAVASPQYGHYGHHGLPHGAGFGAFGPHGLPQPAIDTPEVAAAKAAHFAAHAQARAQTGPVAVAAPHNHYNIYNAQPHIASFGAAYGPHEIPQPVVDTPEVAAAKAAHLAAHAKARAQIGHNTAPYSHHNQYNQFNHYNPQPYSAPYGGPYAHGGLPQPPQETHEVAAARAAHLAAHAAASRPHHHYG